MAEKNYKASRLNSFDFPAGRILASKYEVISKLGAGWEGEVYKVLERNTGIERAAKFFFPQRNVNKKASNFYARKLHRLRQCPILIQYHTEETILYKKIPITMLVSEFVEGELLSDYLKRQPGKRIAAFQAAHLLHALAAGIESIHFFGEYHGDLHDENIIVSRSGLGFELKLLDFIHWSTPRRENIQDDICDIVRIFYDAVGGKKHYSKQPMEVKAICCGLKRSLILKKFRTASQLREYLETMQWS